MSYFHKVELRGFGCGKTARLIQSAVGFCKMNPNTPAVLIIRNSKEVGEMITNEVGTLHNLRIIDLRVDLELALRGLVCNDYYIDDNPNMYELEQDLAKKARITGIDIYLTSVSPL